MQLIRPLPAGLGIWLAMLAQPALAACLITIPTPGILGQSSDGRTLGSSVGLGVPSLITISNLPIGASTITLSNLRLESASSLPPSPTLSGTYSAVWLLGSTSGSISNASPGVIHLNLLSSLAINITLHNTAYSNTGFWQGTHFMKTSVTCS